MNPTVDDLVSQAERLSAADRELLVDRILQSLGAAAEPDIEAAWQREIDRRVDAIDRGEMRTIPWDIARKRLGL